MPEPSKGFRCAVYTRKSSEEGLEQDFNSLHAQREACEAYVRSQRGEGWKLMATAYDDGGISGGTMERPSLRRLMADIESRQVDIVVVYKVDRLTRSLSDFSKMVEVFDRHGVSFVAVTQQFNTTTSMGRLTLNVLLSFAQFEREVTAERIRDKVAASKRKGMWMGGGVPRGYKVESRKLVVVPEEADVVRHIYREFLESEGVRDLGLKLRQEGILSKPNGRAADRPICRGALYTILRNPIYVGLIPHKGQRFSGQHSGIVEKPLWDAVQQKLSISRSCRGRPVRKTEASPLMGKLLDERGRPLTPTHTAKRGRRYRYYVSHEDDRDDDAFQSRAGPCWRLPAHEIEEKIASIIQSIVADRAFMSSTAATHGLDAGAVREIIQVTERAAPNDVFRWLECVQLHADRIDVSVLLPATTPIKVARSIPMVLKMRGQERRLVFMSEAAHRGKPDHRLVKSLSIGLRYWQLITLGQPITGGEFAKAERIDRRYLDRSARLAFLAPAIVHAIAEGRQPANLTAERVLRNNELPVKWEEQRQVLGFSGVAWVL